MNKLINSLAAMSIVAAIAPSPAEAQSVAQFSYDKVCVAPGKVGFNKLLFEIRSEVDANKFGFDTVAYRKAVANSIMLAAFAEQIRNERGRYYQVFINGRPAETINVPQLVTSPDSHDIRCVDYGKPPTPAALARVAVAKRLTEVGSRVIVRKDVDGLDKPLASAAPAQFSATTDHVAHNTAVQSQFTVATEIPISLGFSPTDPNSVAAATPLFLMPYVRHNGLFNSNNRVKDVDNLAFGMALNMYALPLTSWLSATTSLRGEYLTDTVNDKKIYSSELTVSPLAAAAVKWPIEIGQRMYFDGILGGPSIRFDVAGRARYGRVEENGGIMTLQSNSEFLRVGYSAGVDFSPGGTDIFSGLNVYATWIWLHNAIDPTARREVHKMTAGVRYDFDKNYGFTFGVERGRNEDTLQLVDKISAGLTIRLGDRVTFQEPTLQ